MQVDSDEARNPLLLLHSTVSNHYMKKAVIALLLNLLTIISFTQNADREITKIRIRYQPSFSSLPELYEIRLNEGKVDYISPITRIPSGEEERVTKKLNRSNHKKLSELIGKIDFYSINSSTGQGIDGAWFSLNVEYTNGETKQIKIWSDQGPKSLLELHRFLLKLK